jgi:ABC-type transporter Mla subunit MlaD
MPHISTQLREAHPDFAAMCDHFNTLKDAFDMQTKVIADLSLQRDAVAAALDELRAENEALKALLRAKGGAQ